MNTSANANAMQVGGNHYAGSYQHWDFVADLKLGYFEGQVTKYVSRWRKKNGVQDLEKALHFLTKLTELASMEGWHGTSGFAGWKGPRGGMPYTLDAAISRYCESNTLSLEEGAVIRKVASWHSVKELGVADVMLRDIIKRQSGPAEAGAGYVNQDR